MRPIRIDQNAGTAFGFGLALLDLIQLAEVSVLVISLVDQLCATLPEPVFLIAGQLVPRAPVLGKDDDHECVGASESGAACETAGQSRGRRVVKRHHHIAKPRGSDLDGLVQYVSSTDGD